MLANYCVQLAENPLLVQGAGGNVSWKAHDTLWVKASGTWLAHATQKAIFVPVDLFDLKQAIQANAFEVEPKIKGLSGLKPSIETLLHALMPHPIVIHLHAVDILSYLVRENAALQIKALLQNNFQWGLVEYYKPGAALANAVYQCLQAQPKSDIIFLKNHGIVFGGENIEQIDTRLKQLLTLFKSSLYSDAWTRAFSLSQKAIDSNYMLLDLPGVHQLVFSPVLYARLQTDWALYPDQVVFLGPDAFCYESIDVFKKALKTQKTPALVFIKETGVFVTKAFNDAAKAQLMCYLQVILRQTETTALCRLSDEQIKVLLNWDAEQYRQQLIY